MHKPSIASLIATSLFSLGAATCPVWAQTPSRPPPVAQATAGAPGHRQHDGLFFRTFVGPNHTALVSSGPGGKLRVSGAGRNMGLALGRAVADNLVLYGEISVNAISHPTVKLNRAPLGQSDGVIASMGLGPGVAYYFQPSNLYLSATLALASLRSISSSGDVSDPDLGAEIALMVGKEWWVSPNWALGAALRISAGSFKDHEQKSLTWNTGAITAALSATYN